MAAPVVHSIQTSPSPTQIQKYGWSKPCSGCSRNINRSQILRGNKKNSPRKSSSWGEIVYIHCKLQLEIYCTSIPLILAWSAAPFVN